MIKFVAGNNVNPKEKRVFGIGLSFENLDRLKKGQPIMFSMREVCFGEITELNGTDEVFIFADKDEETMKRKLCEGKWDMSKTVVKDFR